MPQQVPWRVVGIQRSILTAFVAAILVSSVASAVVSATPSAAPPPSAVRVAVIMFTLPSATTFAVTPDDVRTTYFGTDRSVATLYALASRGTLQITGDVFGPYAIGGDASTCDLGTWTDAARSAATGAGVDLSSYTNFAFLFPRVDACPWAGLAAIGDSSSYINAPAPGDVGLYHAAHELGHDLGADHAHSLTCAVNGSAVSFAQPDTCTSSEYGDPFSLMGSGIVRLPSAWERMRMGLLNANELTVADAGASASYALADLDSSQPGTRLVLLRRAAGGYLTLEYRLAGGPFDTFAGTSATAGVFVHFVADDQSSDSSLLDATPSTSTMHDAYITPGSRLDDDIDGLSISVTGADSSAAQVTVGPLVVDQEPVTAPPSPPAAPTQVSGSTTGGGSAHLTWQPASDATAATQYRIRRAGAVVAVVSGTTFDDGQTLVSATTYGVQAVDASGLASSIVSVTIRPASDTTAPSAVGQAWATVRGRKTVAISWTAASDNVRVKRYEIQLSNGRTVFTKHLSSTFRKLAAGSYVVTVAALDAAGNIGPATTVTFNL